MTDERMALLEFVEKEADADLVREMLAFAAERLMDFAVEAVTGAAKGARSALRTTQRNGYRERALETRALERDDQHEIGAAIWVRTTRRARTAGRA